jgi:hypothetical protein
MKETKYLLLLKQCFLHPREYAEKIPLTGGFKEPIIFFLVIYGISSFLGLILNSILALNISKFFVGITGIVISLPFSLASLFIFSGILHFIAQLLGGKGDFKGSFRANAYASLPSILSWIPVISILAYALQTYIVIIAFHKLHHYSYRKAVLTVLPFILIVLMLMIALSMLGTLPNNL